MYWKPSGPSDLLARGGWGGGEGGFINPVSTLYAHTRTNDAFLGTNIVPPKALLKMMFLFPRYIWPPPQDLLISVLKHINLSIYVNIYIIYLYITSSFVSIQEVPISPKKHKGTFFHIKSYRTLFQSPPLHPIQKNMITLPESNIAPENRPLEKEIPIRNHHFF